MPFKSEKQRRWMYTNEPEMAERWSREEARAKRKKSKKSTKKKPRKARKKKR